MEIISRVNCLTKLLETIFGLTTINYERATYERGIRGKIIIGKNGLFDKNQYTTKYRKRFEELFDIAFNTESVEIYNLVGFRYSKEKMECFSSFTREILFNNVMKYFSIIGIDIPDYYENPHDRCLLSKLIYKVIVSEILPVIFNNGDNREKKEKIELDTEDISADFESAINNMKKIFESEDIDRLMYVGAQGKNIEFLFKFKAEYLSQCNYFKFFPTYVYCFENTYKPYISIQINELQNETILIPSKANSLELLYNSITKDLTSKSEIDNKYIGINDLKDDKSHIYKFKIFDYRPPCCFLPRFFYYAKEISMYSLSSEYGHHLEGIRFNNQVIDEAFNALEVKYKEDFKKEKTNALIDVCGMLSQLCRIDYKKIENIIKSESFSIDGMDSVLANIKKIKNSLIHYGFEPDSIFRIIIMVIDYSVNNYCDYIEKYHNFRKREYCRPLFFISPRYEFVNRDYYYYERDYYNEIDSFQGIINRLICDREQLINYKNILKINTDDKYFNVSFGYSDEKEEFVPYKVLELDPFERLKKILFSDSELKNERRYYF